MARVVVRPARSVDLGAICAIYNHEVACSVSTFATEPWTLAEQRARLASHDEPHPLLVAEDRAGEVLGWASLSRWSAKGGYRRTVEASVFVHPAHRRRGVAHRLIEELVARAKAAGHRVILGLIEATNEPSRRLLASVGFEPVGVMHAVGEKHGRVLDVEVLELLLERQDDKRSAQCLE